MVVKTVPTNVEGLDFLLSVLPLCSTQTRVSVFLLWSLLPKLSTPSDTTLALVMWYVARHNSVTQSTLLVINLSAH